MDRLRSAWEAFHEGDEPPSNAVPPAILASWRRSRELGVPPDLHVGREADAAADSGAGEPATRLFSDIGQAAVRDLAADLSGSGCVAVLGDARGTVLSRAGDHEITRRTDTALLAPGADWTEGAAGTNGIGLALALGHPVQVVAAEHFCAGWHDYGCTSAPVRNPVTREVLGAITLTTRAGVHDRNVVAALVRRAATAVEQAIRQRLLGPGHALLERHLDVARDGEPRLTLNRRGEVVAANEAAVRLLTVDLRAAVVALARTALAGPSDVAEAIEPPQSPARLHVRVALVRWMDEVAGAVATVEGADVGDMPASLRALERDAILRALERSGGNVTAAAEALGVSRATVYRRMRTYRVLGLPAPPPTGADGSSAP